MNPGDLCICGHTRELHFGHECTIVAVSDLSFTKGDCPCKQFVELGLAVPIFQALAELVAAVHDAANSDVLRESRLILKKQDR